MAHGCYWGKCTFCDISLDYIKVYEPIAAKLLCDRMEELVQQTGQTGFHFVDEAAPPALMRALALEIIRRKMTVSWWTNIRFEKKFTRDLCLLLKASGCIAVSGGLEVASDRLLKLIDKGVTVEQVARVNRNFTDAGIMVHAYLMYGFPTQTIQETVDSLEMVRQLFEIGVLQSAFWHQFAMTAHSPIGLEPAKYGVSKETTEIGTFANNDIVHIDSTGIDHTAFSYGLKKSLYNFMHGIGFELPLQKWFEFKIPRTTIPRDFIENAIEEDEKSFVSPDTKIVWIGKIPSLHYATKLKKGVSYENAVVTFITRDSNFQIIVSKSEGEWLQVLLELISVSHAKILTFQEIQAHYYGSNSDDFEPFWYGKQMDTLRENGLLLL
jgi:hypothetical protein